MDIRTKETYDLLKPVVELIDNVFIIDSVEVITVDEKFKLYSSNTLWLTLGYTIIIDSVEYKVVDLMPNEWIVITGAIEPTASGFDVYAPFFDHGTTLEQNTKLLLKKKSWDKFPLIWLHEKTKEKFDNDPMTIIDRVSDVDLYFIIDTNMRSFRQLDEDRYTIKPMRNLINGFIDACNDYPGILKPFDYDVTDAPKFGVYENSKGEKKRIFNDDVTAEELKSTITFLLGPDDCVN